MAMSDTKRTGDATKPAKPATIGRPRLGAQPLSQAERSRRARARRKAKPKPIRSAEELFADLCTSRGLVTGFDKAVAMEVVNALAAGRLSEALKGLDALPAARVESSSPSMGMSAVKQRFMQLVQNAIAGDDENRRLRIERGEATEADMLRARLAEIERPLPAPDEAEELDEEDEVAALRAEIVELRRLLAGAQPVEGAADTALSADRGAPSATDTKTITPPLSAIVPPDEIGECYAGHRPGPDDGKHRRGPVIDAKAQPAAAKPETEAERGRGDQTRGCQT
jgi:hypothetical protein